MGSTESIIGTGPTESTLTYTSINESTVSESTQTNRSSIDELNVNLFTQANLGNFSSILDMNHSELEAHVNKTNDRGFTLLYLACKEGREDVVRHLLDVKGLNVNFKEGFYEKKKTSKERLDGLASATPFYVSCQLGKNNIVKLLLKAPGIHVNDGYVYSSVYLDSCGYVTTSPLYAACVHGHLETVKLLLECESIDPNNGEVHDHFNSMSCLGICIFLGKWEIANLILESLRTRTKRDTITFFRREPISEILLTCLQGNVNFLKDLLDSNLFKVDNCFPLHFCIKKNDKEMASLLLSHGALTSLQFDKSKGCGYVLNSFCGNSFEDFVNIKKDTTPLQLAKLLRFDIKSLIGGNFKKNLLKTISHNSYCDIQMQFLEY